MMTNLPAHMQTFNIRFPNGNLAQAVRVSNTHNPAHALRSMGFRRLQPVIFVSGGASHMDEQDRHRVHEMLVEVSRFAEEQHAVIVDGGTEAGIMNMVGEIRHTAKHTYPLIGISPLGKISFPGYDNPHAEAELEDSHTNFMLVDGDEWGAESEMILYTVFTLCGDGRLPSVGILINGGKIAMKEVYLASTTAHKLSILVLEGSGRAADEISTAFRSGKPNQAIIKAILAGGDIEPVGVLEGPKRMRRKLEDKFAKYAKR